MNWTKVNIPIMYNVQEACPTPQIAMSDALKVQHQMKYQVMHGDFIE